MELKKDKVGHFVIGFFLTMLGLIRHPLIWLGFIAGVTKEVWDYFDPEGHCELMDLLAKSVRVKECLTRKLTQFSIGRPLVAADARIVRQIHQQAAQAGGTYRSTVTAIINSDLIQKTRTER